MKEVGLRLVKGRCRTKSVSTNEAGETVEEHHLVKEFG